MRLIAGFCTLVCLGGAAWAGWQLAEELRASQDPLTLPNNAALSEEATPPQTARQPRRWTALFGERQPPTPQAALSQPKEEPQPPKAAKPPLSSLGYTLKGMVRDGASSWAIVGHPTGDRLLRVGDMLEPNVRVAIIDAQGLWVSRDEDDPELMAFPE
ncbi:type II secretion system protein N [Shimia sagamensis]|uniref:Type IV pilus biogenesis n=1 Tax=Shimia sagamensis TaxID=1566352 RepID=A0ABY1NCM8_9RHOB|nr:type II secretion system protein N [Shimia sagamensis]SMP05850.1 Type IV pilus biogenesis [Shimia sagamensis]